MKLNEIIQPQFLTGAEANAWAEKHLFIQKFNSNRRVVGPGSFSTTPTGEFLINGDVTFSQKEFKVKIKKINGDLEINSNRPIERYKMHDLLTLPERVTGIVSVKYAPIKSFEGMPLCKSIIAEGCAKIEDIKDIFPFIKGPLDVLDINGGNISNFLGIEKLCKFPIKHFVFDWAESNYIGGLGVLLINGLETICMPHQVNSLSKPWRIISDCLTNKGDIFECQGRLIDAGFEKMAQL